MGLRYLINGIKKYKPGADISLIRKAHNLSKKINGKSIRRGKQTYFKHGLNVAKILVDLKLDEKTISAGLLHDISLLGKTKGILVEEVGKEVVDLVELHNKVNIFRKKSYEKNVDLVRRMLIVTAKDPRVILLQLAAKLDGLRYLQGFLEERRKDYAQEILDVYAPIAQRFGIWKIKNELEDRAFKILKPKEYSKLVEEVKELIGSGDKKINYLKKEIEKILDSKRIEAKIYGRVKQIYSLYRKIYITRKIPLKNISDLIALRIIVKKKEECYTVLGLINSEWNSIPNKFQDLIANPRPNGYQSLQNSFLDKEKKPFEVQIRTEEMHQIAEEGIAAHWRYKGIKGKKNFNKKISWIRETLETDAKNIKELLGLDMFLDNIYCFTPKGQVIELPEGATPLDFAYAIHQKIGDTCSGAKVNDSMKSLDFKLNNGDSVEILTSKNQKPNRDWLNFVVSSKAKIKIRSALRKRGELVKKIKKKKEEELKKIKSLILTEFDYKKIKLASCCNPIPGEKIIGFSTKGGRLTLHKKGCPEINKIKLEKLGVEWNEDLSEPVEIFVEAEDRLGLFTEVINKIHSTGFKIDKVNSKVINIGVTKAMLLIEIPNLTSLKNLIKSIKRIRNVKKVYVGL